MFTFRIITTGSESQLVEVMLGNSPFYFHLEIHPNQVLTRMLAFLSTFFNFIKLTTKPQFPTLQVATSSVTLLRLATSTFRQLNLYQSSLFSLLDTFCCFRITTTTTTPLAFPSPCFLLPPKTIVSRQFR